MNQVPGPGTIAPSSKVLPEEKVFCFRVGAVQDHCHASDAAAGIVFLAHQRNFDPGHWLHFLQDQSQRDLTI
jgi:hypothetical protein